MHQIFSYIRPCTLHWAAANKNVGKDGAAGGNQIVQRGGREEGNWTDLDAATAAATKSLCVQWKWKASLNL